MNSPQLPSEGAATTTTTSRASNLAPSPLSMPAALGMATDMTLGGLPTATQPTETVKRKRGRPRKYVGAEPGATPPVAAASPVNMQLALHTPTATPTNTATANTATGITSSPQGSPFTPTGAKRARGRPLGSGKKYLLGASSPTAGSWAGQSFTPHIITIAAGEDVATKIFSFAQHGPRAVCVMSANGAISTATLRQQSSSGGNVTYEGRYEILSLMGSFLPTGGADSRQRAGGLSVSLACSDGRVIGGGVAGILIAASPIQVVVGSFVSEIEKAPSKAGNGQHSSVGYSPTSSPAVLSPLGLPSPASAPRPAKTTNPASITPGHHQQQQPATATPPSHQQQLVYQPMGLFQQQAMPPWSTTSQHGDNRRTDINISLPGG